MFRKVLVANRGEIAVRIVRACHALGIKTVAVYSDADRTALHVRYADEAYRIGPPPAQESYLRIDRLLEAAKDSGAEAIHPGYGFLAENAGLASACKEAELTFIGPPAGAIAAMGDKVAARRLMEQSGVPVIPGTSADLSDPEMAEQASKIGFPLFIKAAAGGGGKGMRLVQNHDELGRSLDSARREAEKAFGDGRVYLEKAIDGARHVEVQVLADEGGSVIHLGVRECSIQRRHQKLVEEAPSPAVDGHLGQRMGAVACQAARAVGYANAGTVEFLLAADGRFYFLEMNTRLQVEHAITELITGIDIVQEQLRIATGEPLEWKQDEIQTRGWAIECRITAEDPANGFLPTSGRIIRLSQPGGPGIRVDSGIYEGFESSLFYDPLLQKVIAWGNSRDEAVQRMQQALRELQIAGLQTSLPFHQWVMTNDAFLRGSYNTAFFQEEYTATSQRGKQARLAAIVASLAHHEQRQRGGAALALHSGDGETGSLPASRGRSGQAWKLAGRWEALGR